MENDKTFYKDVSLDLETLALTADATILSIAAVNFDMISGKLGHIFYSVVEYKQQNRAVDINTVNWWKKQNPVLREEVFGGTTPLRDVLTSLHKFIRSGQCVWGNGANFDVAILEHAYAHESSFNTPWKFWNGRDMRTRVADAKTLTGFDPKKVPSQGLKHHALADAAYQAKVISAAYNAIHNATKDHC